MTNKFFHVMKHQSTVDIISCTDTCNAHEFSNATYILMIIMTSECIWLRLTKVQVVNDSAQERDTLIEVFHRIKGALTALTRFGNQCQSSSSHICSSDNTNANHHYLDNLLEKTRNGWVRGDTSNVWFSRTGSLLHSRANTWICEYHTSLVIMVLKEDLFYIFNFL